MGRRPLPAVRDLARDGRWSTYDVSVLNKMGGRCAQTRHHLKLPSPTKLARLGHFPPINQAGRLAGPVFYVCVFSQVGSLGSFCHYKRCLSFLGCSSQPSTKYNFSRRTLVHLVMAPSPSKLGRIRAGSPVSVSLVIPFSSWESWDISE